MIFHKKINNTPLHSAILKENVDIVKLLLSSNKIDVNILNTILIQ